ncbi:arylsulfatase A-like enzyme [Ereboglobus sp. PH5-10]|uniref:sulfatase family protein n=1 Tax=Ereboglobus sp. PH5-10 TaxID=2940629 RepID=UPI002405D614|nr:sulfatase [Ereboglobus sp. PH5-10]MDF9827890.1 arylsulfatase A-like enzyme [Ereboglobus sp. PH5-10]
MKTNLLKKLLLPSAMLVPLAAVAAQPQTPNVIVIFMDDMGYGDIGTTGAIGYDTPNLDKMAAEGMHFTRFYAAQAVCTASRVGLLTGCYPNRIGYSGALGPSSRIGLGEKEETIADVLRKKGYATAAFGKWHLGHLPHALPTRHGFDEYYGIPYSNDMWPRHPTRKFPDLPLIEGDKPVELNPDQSQFTANFTNRALQFIDKNKNKPFFIYLAHPMPHVPLAVSEKFKGKSRQGLYGDVIMEIDWSVGQILDKLRREGLEENTLVVVTSDNGPWLNYGNHAGTTGGLREGKGTSFEGGQRVPCIMQWKGVIPAATICNKLSSTLDLLPTFAHIAGAPPPPHKIDGVNIISLLRHEPDANPRESFCYYYRKNSLEAVTDGNFKLIFPHPHRTYEGFAPGADGKPGPVNGNAKLEIPLLYDLRRDPGERYNVIGQYPEVRAKLEQIAAAIREDIGDDLTGVVGKNNRRPSIASR